MSCIRKVEKNEIKHSLKIDKFLSCSVISDGLKIVLEQLKDINSPDEMTVVLGGEGQGRDCCK